MNVRHLALAVILLKVLCLVAREGVEKAIHSLVV